MIIISRRKLIALTLPALTLTKNVSGQTLKSQLGRNETYVALRGNINKSDGIWSYTGSYWGKPDKEIARELFHVDGLSFNSLKLLKDGTIVQKMVECGFWKKPEDGSIADTWTNPLNNLECIPQHFKSSQNITFSPNGRMKKPENLGNNYIHLEGQIREPIKKGSSIWSQERLIVKSIRPEPKENSDPLTYNGPIRTGTSLATYRANINDLSKEFVPSTMHFQSISGWYPWMRMGQRSGVCSFELIGRKIKNISEISNSLKKFLENRRPGFIENPWGL